MSDTQPTSPATTGEANNQPADDAPKGPQSLEEALAEIAELKNDREKYKSLMRKEEGEKKDLWKKVQDYETANLSETERAVREAEQRGREAGKAESDAEVKSLKLKAAAATAGVPEEVLGLLDPNKVFTPEGEPNLELLSSLSGGKRKFEKTAADLNIGAQSNSNAGQLSYADLERMTPAQINKAREEGRLDALMRGQL
ncbi:hypothetical protein E1264_03565 [Actinomadura sp. KC216]|uniref:hypothetical protein n=1 Tax=Actinomadura sp. KC216 TaxID=2530370 RepID=UPI00104CD455|nr:hypothetical protein [Actinomadura sp. KC216]TDB90916.1 hypothetical protein E1264_03565 [Actinomadura sp. KC216]